jgi:hypothetical protein
MQARATLQRLLQAARRFASALGSRGTSGKPAAAPGLATGALRTPMRLVLVFAPRPGMGSLEQQRAILADARPALSERDVVPVFIVGDEVAAEAGFEPGAGAAALRARFSVPRNTFRAILVGDGGGAKLRSNKPLSAEALIKTIDALPLRQHERRRRARPRARVPAARSSLKREPPFA